MTENLKFLKDKKLLLVEDDEILLENIYNTLSLFFDHIVTAKDGEEGILIYKNEKIDLVITDYVMPKKSGYDLCSFIRKDNKNIPIIIMSNYSDKEKLLKAIPLNLTKYLIKPVSYDDLCENLSLIATNFEDDSFMYEEISEELLYSKSNKILLRNKKRVKLTKNEILLMELLIENRNSLVSMNMIDFALGAKETKSDQAIKNIVHRLRQKIGKDVITNSQSLGYMLK